ncbi:hypothetical protein AFULGI_00006750 [Archaeoglobus fulgidus DSM 8774]|uniref:Sulfotransferase domain protein n=1 Tax=Archaeoglobus fulgidus DSM 8774 TaxID=1344584 RepID=A0A075WBZ1_ARCFL|nr:sulfotransferase family protein [Archaeoglobus fulgidus]AIG97476.1 hypothetical protein AFULGI_00006750 [Archaeoglobus fulgidus DSM 8774]
MIKFVFNGYYRSGTTIFYKILNESNPSYLCLYEPLSPHLFEDLTNPEKIVLHLHGFHPYKCYRHLNSQNLDEFQRIHKDICQKFKNYGDNIPIHLSEVVELFDFLNNLEKDTIIQPNRCHFILSQLAQRYRCTFIHIIRNPIDVWIGQTLEPLVLVGNVKRAKLVYKFKNTFIGRYVLTKYLPNREWVNGFAINENFKLIKDIQFGLSRSLDLLDKMLVVWTYCNYYAFKQADNERGMIVYYEEVTREPEKWLKIMTEFSGVNFDLKYAKILKPRITKDEKLRKHFVERLERLGLIDMVNEFYPPKRWFG